MAQQSYVPDVFDNPPEGPVGVHRGSRAWYAIVLPYIIVALCSLVVGLLAWMFFSGNLSQPHSSSQGGKQTVSSAPSLPRKEPSDADSTRTAEKDHSNDGKSTSDKNNDDTSSNHVATIDKSVAVRVINATNIQGHAAAGANKLKQAGYNNVTADNPKGRVPSVSTVWYKDEAGRAAAQDIAKIMGVQAVEQASEIQSSIVVVLCK